MSNDGMTIEEAISKIERDAPYWAPETRAGKLQPYLHLYGEPIERALLRMPSEMQEVCGFALLWRKDRDVLTRMVETGQAPPQNKVRNKEPWEVRAFARPRLYRMLATEVLAPVDGERLALDFVLQSPRLDSQVVAVGTFDEILAEVARLGGTYEMGSFQGRAAKPGETSHLWEP